MRLVTVQQGQGTRVRPLADWDLLNHTVLSAVVRHDADNSILEDLVDVRRALEAQMAGQAATHATDADKAAITECMKALDVSINDPTAYLTADVAFHDAIMTASRNRLGRAMIRTVTGEAYRSMRFVGNPSSEHIRLTNEAHQRVHEAVLAGDAEAAGRAMDEHILESWQRRRPAREKE
jgi:GntR family galactonate operon transcriptional repressor